jgi:hypothetical protein
MSTLDRKRHFISVGFAVSYIYPIVCQHARINERERPATIRRIATR